MKTIDLAEITTSPTDQAKEAFARDVLLGLCSTPKNIPSKYFYDDEGSLLFQKITQAPDYYLTRCELGILGTLSPKLPKHFPEEALDIVELGAGDGHKTKLILDGFLAANKRLNYLPIDISAKAMDLLRDNIQETENIEITAIVGTYLDGLKYIQKNQSQNRKLLLFLGSNIGNLTVSQQLAFMRQIWSHLSHDDYVLIGFDLKKNIATLSKAYNDKNGYTREFNFNLLNRINRELQGNFDLSKFEHLGQYNPIRGAMESYLVAADAQTVYIKELEHKVHFRSFEPIHLEYSYKFLESQIEDLANQTGFELCWHEIDSTKNFCDSIWRVQKA